MNNWIDITNYSTAIAGMIVVLLGLLMSIFSRYQEKWNRRFFVILIHSLSAKGTEGGYETVRYRQSL